MTARRRGNGAGKAAPPAVQLRRQRIAASFLSELATIAAGFGGQEFGLFLVQAGPAQCRLQPVLDNEFPKLSRLSKRLASKMIAGRDCRLQVSTRPFWWRGGGKSGALVHDLADEENLLGLAGTGIALPLHAGPGRDGLVVFQGDDMHVAEDALLDAHLRCLHLFETVDGLQIGTPRSRLVMSNRELDCLRLTAEGKTSPEIGGLLGLSRHTTDQYLNSACQKLNAVNRTQAVSKAIRTGLIS